MLRLQSEGSKTAFSLKASVVFGERLHLSK
jgi:hypothetical protein